MHLTLKEKTFKTVHVRTQTLDAEGALWVHIPVPSPTLDPAAQRS